MTSEEIVRALRCTATVQTGDEPCESCPFRTVEKLSAEEKERFGMRADEEWENCNVDGIAYAAADLIERLEKELQETRKQVREMEDALETDECTLAEMLNVLEAYKEGRVVVLPCKRGDELWTYCTHPYENVYATTVTDISTLNGRTILNTSLCGVVDARDVGKTVYLTAEEAEKALKARKDETS